MMTTEYNVTFSANGLRLARFRFYIVREAAIGKPPSHVVYVGIERLGSGDEATRLLGRFDYHLDAVSFIQAALRNFASLAADLAASADPS